MLRPTPRLAWQTERKGKLDCTPHWPSVYCGGGRGAGWEDGGARIRPACALVAPPCATHPPWQPPRTAHRRPHLHHVDALGAALDGGVGAGGLHKGVGHAAQVQQHRVVGACGGQGRARGCGGRAEYERGEACGGGGRECFARPAWVDLHARDRASTRPPSSHPTRLPTHCTRPPVMYRAPVPVDVAFTVPKEPVSTTSPVLRGAVVGRDTAQSGQPQ